MMISPRRASAKFDIRRVRAEGAREVRDAVAVEEPLEIRVRPAGAEETAVAVTMRTPGHDFELAAGFLFSEGLVANRPEIAELSYCADVEPQQYNIVTARLRPGASFNPSMLNRNFYATSSCGVCGKASLEALEMEGCEPIADTGMRVPEGARRNCAAARRCSTARGGCTPPVCLGWRATRRRRRPARGRCCCARTWAATTQSTK